MIELPYGLNTRQCYIVLQLIFFLNNRPLPRVLHYGLFVALMLLASELLQVRAYCVFVRAEAAVTYCGADSCLINRQVFLAHSEAEVGTDPHKLLWGYPARGGGVFP